jgi:hypothetical protein
VFFDYGAIGQVIVKRQAGVIDEDVERLDALESCLNLRRVGHIHGQRCDASIRVAQGLACTGVHPLRASSQGFLDQRLPDAAIGPGHQNCSVCDRHYTLLLRRNCPRRGQSLDENASATTARTRANAPEEEAER